MKEAKGKRIAESMLAQGLITSDLEYAGDQFDKLLFGDIILIHKGAFPIALVRVKHKCAEEELSTSSFGIDYKIELLSRYEDLSDKEKAQIALWGNCPPTGTFFKISSGNETFNRISQWHSLITFKMERENILHLLKQKKQIIFQGPPGTGKTKLAKEIANEMCRPREFSKVTKEHLKAIIQPGSEVKTVRDGAKFSVVEVVNSVKIKISTGSTYTISLQAILNSLAGEVKSWDEPIGTYLESLVRYAQHNLYKVNGQIQLLQFHPSYSYEDFVRGIRTAVTDGQIEYVNEDRILASFAKSALENFHASTRDIEVVSKESWVSSMMREYADSIRQKLEKDPKYKIGESVAYIFDVEDNAFRYKGDGWERHYRGLRMKFNFLEEAYLKGANSRKDFQTIYASGLANEHATYFFKVLTDFKEFLKGKPTYGASYVKPELLNYVLIIDEINRANLSSVLGELIYALEYRNEPVLSMYAVDDDYRIILPPNLYIIGTMNTADRSVGHIDYAIRRRFAFYPVMPDEAIVREKGSIKSLRAFGEMKRLFINAEGKKSEFLSPDFDPYDVMLGHSYFLAEDDHQFDFRMKYEIIPILKEYVKDAILTEHALNIINQWYE